MVRFIRIVLGVLIVVLGAVSLLLILPLPELPVMAEVLPRGDDPGTVAGVPRGRGGDSEEAVVQAWREILAAWDEGSGPAPWSWSRDMGLPEVSGSSALLMDGETGIILGVKNPDKPIPPASLTKLMTIHLALEQARIRGISWDDPVEYGPEAWAENAPPRSSLMFLGPHQDTSLREILLGLAVSSGNDAAVGIAQFTAGSVPAFVALMNREAQALGLDDTYFEEPSGYSEFNQTTARDLGRFVYVYLRRHPDVVETLHAVREFTYPTREDLPTGEHSPYLGITQYNRNGLLFDYPGADGLKTGYIDESGYNIIATAQRGDRRLVAIVLGAPGASASQGSANREQDAAVLLDYGFSTFHSHDLVLPRVRPPEVWFGGSAAVIGQEQRVRLVLPAGPGEVSVESRLPGDLTAPIPRGSVVGAWQMRDAQGELMGELPVVIRNEIPFQDGIAGLADRARLFWRSAVGKPLPQRFIPASQ